MTPTRSALDRAWGWLRRRLPVMPRSYWEQRHDQLAGQLAAVGHVELSDDANARDYAVRREHLAAALEPMRPRPGETRKLLDAGCGTGLLFPTWLELGFDVEGMDFASKEARGGQGPGGVPIRLGDICELPASENHDVIACVDVLFHVLSDRKWERFLETSARAIAKEGRVVIQEQLVDEGAYAGVQRHCHFRRASDYERAAARAGLALVSHERYALPMSGAKQDILVYRRADTSA
jgi:predicted TPR repeat methyltransferase